MSTHLRSQWRAAQRRTALPQSWRPYSHDLVQHLGDAVILTDSGNTRSRVFEVYTYGSLIARRHSLDEAKAEVEAVYGPLEWKRHRNAPYELIHYYFGPTVEFTEPAIFYSASLPRLGSLGPHVQPGAGLASSSYRPSDGRHIGGG